MLKNSVKKYCADGSRINQFFMAFFLIIPAFSYGAAIGWMSPMAVKLMSEEDTPAETPLSETNISWMASIVYLVGTPAVFLFAYIVDNFGRKKALILTSVSMVICWSLKIYSTETWVLILARAMIGFGVTGAYIVAPLYIKEISEDSIRGMLGSFVILSQNFGNLLGYVMGEYLNYDVVSWICMSVPLLHAVTFTALPESPSFLLKRGKIDEAREVLAWLRCRQPDEVVITAELQVLQVEIERDKQSNTKMAYKTLFSDKTSFRAFRIIVIVTLARELCGCLAVLHFASTIFDRAGAFVLTPNQQAAVLGAVQLVGSCTASTLVERTGRKPLLGGTCFISGLAMGSLGLWFYMHEGLEVPQLGSLPIAALCVCIFCDAAGLQPMPFVIMTEIFTFKLRGTVTSLVIAFACILASVQLRLFQPVVDYFGMYMVFCIFTTVCILSTLYIVLYVPETKMKTLDEIYAEIAGNKKCKDNEAAVTRL